MKPNLKTLTLNRWGGALCAMAFVGCLVGCTSPSRTSSPAQSVKSETSVTSVDQTRKEFSTVDEKPSPLSYGSITSRVKKGVTTQSELIELFGGPNISTLDTDGTETWVYERTSSHSETATDERAGGSGTVDLQRLDIFFGLGLYHKGSGQTEGKTQSTAHSTTTRTVKTLTVIVKFNPDKTVKEYSTRASYF